MFNWFRSLTQPSGDEPPATTKARGDQAEGLACRHLQSEGLMLLTRNFKTPGRGGGEIDLIMRDANHCLVFVEVRARASDIAGGAAASITVTKRRRIILAARYYLSRLPTTPTCRFDVVAVSDQSSIVWIKNAFTADE